MIREQSVREAALFDMYGKDPQKRGIKIKEHKDYEEDKHIDSLLQ
jgi:hypothetical protein